MKRIWKILIGLLVILIIAVIVFINTFLRHDSEWTFIQSVGGIKIENPIKTEDGYYLPINCNVSGQDSVTINPTTINSALSCISTNYSKVDKNIYLQIVEGIAFSNYENCKCNAINIGKLASGNYKVFYKDDVDEYLIGEFSIKDY